MVIKEKDHIPQEAQKQMEFPLPPLGRTVEVVGPWESVEAAQTPHEKNKRAELGKPLFNWYFNRTAKDPLSRVGFPQSANDVRQSIPHVVGQAPKGKANAEKTVADRKAMTQHIKRVARFLGGDVVGIAASHPSMIFTGGRTPEDGTGITTESTETPEELARKYPYIVCQVTTWDYDLGKAHRHHIGDHAYHFSQAKVHVVYANLANHIRELGYSAVQGRVQGMPADFVAGIGEMGRNGMLITEKFGSRIHIGNPILTDMPLVPDKPLDIGVANFCRVCRKCANTCPTNSISNEDKVLHNGVKKFKINWETCYRLRPYVMDFWETCMTCVTVCPYTKPNTWWRAIAIESLKRTPFVLRAPVVRGMKLLDDVVWGKVPRKRVKWLDYDTGILHTKKGQKGAAAGADEAMTNGKKDIGYYLPLKENTRRFEIQKGRETQKK